MSVRILHGDCRDVLLTLPNESVHCCVTSPPYFGLRDYDVPPTDWPEVIFKLFSGMPEMTVPAMSCCHGLESDPYSFIAHEVLIFREVRRILRDDGTLWLNIGDSYASAGGQSPQSGKLFKGRARQRENICISQRGQYAGIKSKDLMGIPWMLAFALRADGWFLRQDIIWSKPNPMPESVTDRCTKAHEYMFLLTKSARYYFDADAIKEPLASASIAQLSQPGLDAQHGSDRVPGKTNGNMKAVRAKGNRKTFRGGGVYTAGQSFDNDSSATNDSIGNAPNESDVRNKRSVWSVATRPFKEAHFATFPPALVEPCILAGCPVGGTVLDPFGGAGTTGLVAERLQRNSILIELNHGSVNIARNRIVAEAPLLAAVANA